MCAAAQKFDDLELVRFIKKYGEHPCFFRTNQGYKCLMYIAFLPESQLSYQMIGSDYNILIFLSLGMSPSYIKYMIENGANVNYKEDIHQQTPLMKACVCGNYETVKMLLDAGADPTHKTTANQSALSVALSHNSAEIFFLIYDALFQRKPSETELLQYLALTPPVIQNVIKQTHGDRFLLNITQRLCNFVTGQYHMTAKEVGYSLEKLTNYDHADELANELLKKGNSLNNSQMIHVLLHIMYRQKKILVILKGYNHAMEILCGTKILNLYFRYIWRLDEACK